MAPQMLCQVSCVAIHAHAVQAHPRGLQSMTTTTAGDVDQWAQRRRFAQSFAMRVEVRGGRREAQWEAAAAATTRPG